jgi:hypothetical protein
MMFAQFLGSCQLKRMASIEVPWGRGLVLVVLVLLSLFGGMGSMRI